MISILLFLATAWLANAAPAASLPAIAKFSATPAQVTSSQLSTLSWTVTGATSLQIDQDVGAVTGTSVKVNPKATTTYTLTATNASGSRTATATVTVGKPPVITSFTGAPAMMTSGQSATLSWAVTGSTSLKIDSGVGSVTGTSVKVTPKTTITYTLTATNAFGSGTATASITVGSPPAITSFTASPAKITPGQSSTLTWAVTGSPGMIINPGVGPVTGTSVKVSPATTTTYTLSATNSFGVTKATVTIAVGYPPVINLFSTNPNIAAGPGVSATLIWTTTGATSLSIDHGVGTVTGTSVKVSPSAPTTYTLTATNLLGSVAATVKVNYIPLTTVVSSQLYYSEHTLFLIPDLKQVTWTGSNSWSSVFSTANTNSYVARLKSVFPDDYVFVVMTANKLSPNNVPDVSPARHVADGIGSGAKGVGVPSICRYNAGGYTVIDGTFGVLDHEIGHIWGIFLGPEVRNPHGHWLANSTATGQMAEVYSDDDYATVKLISGDPVNGFTWTAVDNLTLNETETFSLQDLYLQGLNPTFPDVYVFDSPVYQADHTVTYASVEKYDQAWVEQHNGLRYPTYRTSDKKFRTGFIYIARDLAEILAVYQPIERSINQFVNAEQIDTKNYRFQVPFLVNTHYRASVDARLADLDGNHTPTLSLGATNLASSDGSAVVHFTAADRDGPAPVVSCVPASANCSISGKNVVLSGLSSGTHFFTIKAQDAGGKKAFAHFVVDVQ